MVAVLVALSSVAVTAHAGISGTGDIFPTTDPATWTISTKAHIGSSGVGSVIVDAGSDLLSGEAYLSYGSSSTGAVTISGAGSTWTNSWKCRLGWYGNGTLNITDGGLVTVGHETHMLWRDGLTGAIHFDNGTLTTRGFLGAAAGLSGTGTINATCFFSDVDLIFDATHGLEQTLTLNGLGQNITVNMNVNGSAPMGAGYGGEGSMHISDGMVVQSTKGYVGYEPGSKGVVTVSGAGSQWINSEGNYIGYCGDGTLAISNGGAVQSSGLCYIGTKDGSTGAVMVSGVDSTWTIGNDLRMFGDGPTLDITDGGTVSDENGLIDPSSSSAMVTVSGAGSAWTHSKNLYVNSGRLDITNGGVVVNNYSGYVANAGTVTVSGDGSIWDCRSYLYVGSRQGGTLSILDGGVVNTGGYGNISSYIGGLHNYRATGTVTVTGAGSTWNNEGTIYVGHTSEGTLSITNGGGVNNTDAYIGYDNYTDENCEVTVSGVGSTWINSGDLFVGQAGHATLAITDGGVVRNCQGVISSDPGIISVVTVSGAGSTWTNSGDLSVGHAGNGILEITDGGMVSVAGVLNVGGYSTDYSYLAVATGGMLAIAGEADDSLVDFLELCPGRDNIRYWDLALDDWADITGATAGEDYWLSYLTEGDLAGYTVLTVTAVPEPTMLGMLAMGGLALLRRCRRKPVKSRRRPVGRNHATGPLV